MNRLRLALRRSVPGIGLGAHLHRRMGQSQEFREYRPYCMGDDIRTVDWLASRRRGAARELVVRTFEAEARHTLFVLIDLRPAMRLPEGAEKLQVAIWILQCLAHAAFGEGDRLIVGGIFGPPGFRPVEVRGPAGLRPVTRIVQEFLEERLTLEAWKTEPRAGTGMLVPWLRPASAVAVLSDMAFSDPANAVARFARVAQKNYRTLNIVEIDSWPMERARLKSGPFRLLGLEGREFGPEPSTFDSNHLNQVEDNLAAHQGKMRRLWRGPGLVWPAQPLSYPSEAAPEPLSLANWFRKEFPRAPFLHGLLSRAAP